MLTKNRSVETCELDLKNDTVRIYWVIRVQEDGQEIASKSGEKVYKRAQKSEMYLELPQLYYNSIVNLMGW